MSKLLFAPVKFREGVCPHKLPEMCHARIGGSDFGRECFRAAAYKQAKNEYQGHRIEQAIPVFQGNSFATKNPHDLKKLFAVRVTEHEPQSLRTVEQQKLVVV